MQENRQSLIVVKLTDFDQTRLSRELTYLLQSLTYLAWPNTHSGETEFWQKLKLALWKKSSSYSNIPLTEELI